MIAIFKDTNTLNENSDNSVINELERLAMEFPEKVSIEIATVLETELRKGSGSDNSRLRKSSEYIYSYEVMVLGESRLGASVVGSEQDYRAYRDLLKILFGDKPMLNYKSNDKRDALHIHTAIRNGGKYFITYDKKLLRRSKEILSRFNSLMVCSPEECLNLVLERIELIKETGHWVY